MARTVSSRKPFRLDYGIDDIIDTRSSEEALPQRSTLLPPDLAAAIHSTQWERPFDTTAFLERSLRPSLGDARLLLPSAFSGIVSRALDELTALMHEGKDCDGNIAMAVSVLREEQALRLLVDEYRNALLQG